MEQIEQEQRLHRAPDGQVSLTDPDARSMATSGRGTGMVGYNVQSAVDDKHHLIVAHEVTNVGHDRNALTTIAEQARLATEIEDLNVVADPTAEKRLANPYRSLLWQSWRLPSPPATASWKTVRR